MTSEDGQDRGRRFNEIAMAVRNREAGRCRRCGETEDAERLSIHHLVPDADVPEGVDAHLPVNLVALCRECHSELENRPLDYQLRELGIDSRPELLLSERARKGLNDRLRNAGPDILRIKEVSRRESEAFLGRDFGRDGGQADLSDFRTSGSEE